MKVRVLKKLIFLVLNRCSRYICERV